MNVCCLTGAAPYGVEGALMSVCLALGPAPGLWLAIRSVAVKCSGLLKFKKIPPPRPQGGGLWEAAVMPAELSVLLMPVNLLLYFNCASHRSSDVARAFNVNVI